VKNMNKTWLIFLMALLVALLPVMPALADEPENVAPVIEEDSLVFQIVNDGGIAWGWSADGSPNPGYRTLPYILNGERLYFQLEVSDANGEADLNGMMVYLDLAPGLYFIGSLVSTTIDADAGIYRGLYSGEAVADERIPAGKADLTIEVIDPAGADDFFNPMLYEPNADILKPDISLIENAPSVIFPESGPGDTGIVATGNPVLLTPQAVIGEEHIPVVFTILHSGTDMVSGNDTIPVGSIVWGITDNITDDSLSGDEQIIASDVAEGTAVEVYYWLNVPSSQPDGDYSGRIDYDYIAD
jgi:hypothetical protein